MYQYTPISGDAHKVGSPAHSATQPNKDVITGLTVGCKNSPLNVRLVDQDAQNVRVGYLNE